MKKLFFLLMPVIMFSLLLSPVLVGAADKTLEQSITGQLKDVGSEAYSITGEPTPLPKLIGKYINIFLSILGVLFVILIVYGGYSWMTAYGNEQKLTKAKDTIINAVIGLIIVLAAYTISSFVVTGLMKATVGT